jgi:hypothetical protein
MLAYSRPFWPLFLHVLGAMVLVGAMLAVLLLTLAAWRDSKPYLARAAFKTLLFAAIPAWLVMRLCAQWIYSKEFGSGGHDPTWVGIGFIVGDLGLLILLLTTGFAFWWKRSGKVVAGRIVTGLSSLYLVMLAIAWLAMSGKWD